MQPSRRHTSGSPRAALCTAAAALAAAALLGTAGAGAGPALASTHPKHAPGRPPAARKSQSAHNSHASGVSHKGWVKYFIVAPPRHGAKEFLFEIAADTLGEGSRAKEVFNLNKGRLQPGGGRLENPTVILPGWILILPPDAHGPGVHFGPLPTVLPVAAIPGPSASPSAPQPVPARHRRAVTPAARPGQRAIEAAISGALVVALLLATGFLLMRRRKLGNKRRRPDPARPSAARAALGGPGDGRPLRARPGAQAARPAKPGPRRRDRKERPADPGLPAPLPQATVLASDPAPPLAEPTPGGSAWAGQPAEPGPLDAAAYPSWLTPPTPENFDAATPVMPRSPATPAIPGPDLTAPALPTPAAPTPGAGPGPNHEDVTWPDFLDPADSGAAAQGQGGPAGPTIQPRPAGPPVVSMAPDVASATADLPPWLAGDSGSLATEPSPAEHEPELLQQRSEKDRLDAQRSEAAFSPVALRLLGAQRSAAQRAGDADVPVQRHVIGFGEDRIEIVLAEVAAASQDSRPGSGSTSLTATPYLVWTPLPYEAPDGGTAFACLGIGDEGCLFIDLAAAPGAVVIGGERAAASRLAESIVQQLGMSTTPGQSRVVIVVGDVVPEPSAAAAVSVPSLGDLASASGTGARDAIEIVFSELRSDDDAFALARYVASNQRPVVPVVLADLADAPWSFTAQPSPQSSDAPSPARSSDALDPASA